MSTNLVSLVRNLQQRKGRKRRGLAVAEGVRLVEEALAAEVEFRGVVASPGLSGTPRGAALLRDLTARAVQVEEVSDRQLAALADTDTPQGIVAVIRPPRFQLGDVRPDPRVPTLVLDGVQDPGNVGTLLRTAFALGSPGAILLEGTADVANPKVMRAAMGATFRLPAAPAAQGELVAWAEQHAVEIWAADPEGTPLERATPPGRLAIVVGNEGTGVRPAVAALARHRVAIRLARGAESLNVAVAAGILLYEVHRAAT
jgi:TrmH family RNA methyltransferase